MIKKNCLIAVKREQRSEKAELLQNAEWGNVVKTSQNCIKNFAVHGGSKRNTFVTSAGFVIGPISGQDWKSARLLNRLHISKSMGYFLIMLLQLNPIILFELQLFVSILPYKAKERK